MIRYSTGGEGVIYFWYLKEGRLSPFWETMECSKRLYCPWILTGQDVQSSNRYKLWCTRHTFEAHWNGGIIEIGVLIGIMALINKNTFKGGGGGLYSKGGVYWKEGAKSIVSLLISVLSEWGNCNFLDPPPSKISMSSQTFSFTISMPKIDSLRFHKKIPVPCRIS